MAVTFSFKAFFDGIGKTHVHMIASVLEERGERGAVHRVRFFGKLGAPAMGMAGAGLAGAASSWLGSAGDGRAGRPQPLSHRRTSLSISKGLSRDLLGRILRLSVPSAIATIAVMSGFMLFAMIVSKLDSVSALARWSSPIVPVVAQRRSTAPPPP